MYSSLPNFIIGFHGCDRTVAEKVVSQQTSHLISSKNKWDWLGHGIYFWEYNYQRALDWAHYLMDNPQMTSKNATAIKTPAAIGAVIDLGKCLNLLDGKSIEIVQRTYELTREVFQTAGTALPQNTENGHYLDCAVINAVNVYMKAQGQEQYDTVRGMFYEGKALYENSGFWEQSHIQICVINPNCIKGYFHPMSPVSGHDIP